jgi:uncharacterized protein (DUF1800 family)
MEFLRGSIYRLVAIVVSFSLSVPAQLALAQEAPEKAAEQPGEQATEHAPNHALDEAAHRPGYRSSQLQGNDRVIQALNRFTFGPRPGEVEAVQEMGLEKWFDEQLHPANLDETDLNTRLAQYPAMTWSTQDLLFRLPSNAIIRQAANGKIEVPSSGTLHSVYENQIYRLQAKKENKQEKTGAAKASSGTAQATGASAEATAGDSASGNMNADAGMVASTAMAQAEMDQPGTAQNTPGAATRTETEQDLKTMTPTDANAAPVDEAQIQGVLTLAPEERVRRLQQMQPEEFYTFTKSLRPAQRKALTKDMTPDLRESVEDLENPEQTVVQELFAERLARDIYSNAQLQEVMTDFWLNHFNVYLRKNEQMPYYLVSYERDVVRPHALGKFEDLLEAVAHSPAMLIYLDNAESVGPDSLAAERTKMGMARRPNKKRQDPPGINENYARELMELHTLGVNGGYTQADVIQVARVLTGWTVDRPQLGGGFQFNPNRHEPGTKTVMGTKIKDNGEMEGRELLHFLATRPATAHFIARELAIRFVSDDPPHALVEQMAKTYMSTGGDIPSMMKTLFHSPQFWAASDYRAKVKTPIEFVASAVRASNADVENYMPLVNVLRQLGMPLYGCIPPVGYKWDEAAWVSTGSLVDRMNFAVALAGNRLPGVTVDWAPELDMSVLNSDTPAKQVIPTPETEEARLEPMLVPGGVSATTRLAALEEFQKQIGQMTVAIWPVSERTSKVSKSRPGAPANRGQTPDQYEREDQMLAGLLMGSPEFQRR